MFSSEFKAKRLFDISILILAHLLLSPIWAILWIFIPILIWIEDKGPVFFRQTRVGYKGNNFEVIKLNVRYIRAYAVKFLILKY